MFCGVENPDANAEVSEVPAPAFSTHGIDGYAEISGELGLGEELRKFRRGHCYDHGISSLRFSLWRAVVQLGQRTCAVTHCKQEKQA